MRVISYSVAVAFGISAIGLTMAAQAAPERSVYQCTRGDMSRAVEVVTDMEASPVCEVWYDKPQETSTRQRLWSANNDASFCADRAADFVEKLRGWGWSCAIAAADSVMDEGGPDAAAEDMPQDQ